MLAKAMLAIMGGLIATTSVSAAGPAALDAIHYQMGDNTHVELLNKVGDANWECNNAGGKDFPFGGTYTTEVMSVTLWAAPSDGSKMPDPPTGVPTAKLSVSLCIVIPDRVANVHCVAYSVGSLPQHWPMEVAQ